jgi:hypothetical protein
MFVGESGSKEGLNVGLGTGDLIEVGAEVGISSAVGTKIGSTVIGTGAGKGGGELIGTLGLPDSPVGGLRVGEDVSETGLLDPIFPLGFSTAGGRKTGESTGLSTGVFNGMFVGKTEVGANIGSSSGATVGTGIGSGDVNGREEGIRLGTEAGMVESEDGTNVGRKAGNDSGVFGIGGDTIGGRPRGDVLEVGAFEGELGPPEPPVGVSRLGRKFGDVGDSDCLTGSRVGDSFADGRVTTGIGDLESVGTEIGEANGRAEGITTGRCRLGVGSTEIPVGVSGEGFSVLPLGDHGVGATNTGE